MPKVMWGWGHSLKSYVLMFDLKEQDLQDTILDVAAGASSFNAEMYKRGYHAVSSDPLYATAPNKITQAVQAMMDNLEQKVINSKEKFLWKYVENVEELMARQRAMAEIFLNDFPQGLEQKRYLPDALPKLPFTDYQFSLVVCANFLFDGPYQDLDFQLNSIMEMCRVGREARIFPLLDAKGDISPNLGSIMAMLQAKDYGVEIREVAYHLQHKGNAMLRVWPKKCHIA